jgi:hypothetical protein
VAALELIEGGGRNERDSALARLLLNQAIDAYRRLVGTNEAFWEARSRLWVAHSSRLIGPSVQEPPGFGSLIRGDPTVVAYGTIGACLRALAGDGRDLAEALVELACARVLERDIRELQTDLSQGRVTAVTVIAHEEAAVFDPELVYLVAASRGLHDRVLTEAIVHGHRSQEQLHGLPLLLECASAVVARLEATRTALKVGAPIPSRRRTRARIPDAEAAKRHGRGFLLSDPWLREGWEVQRREGLGVPEMTSLFPVCFALEALASTGAEVSDRVAWWLNAIADRSFAYYDHPDFDALDADTVGAVLRLSRWVPGWLEVGDLVLRLEKAMRGRSRVPVWLERAGDHHLRLTGEGCPAVEANLLLGLRVGAPDRFASLGIAPLRGLLADFAKGGAAIAIDYVPEYLLMAVARLLADLAVESADPGPARGALQKEIDRRRLTRSPQTAAWLILATVAHDGPGRTDRRWIDVLLGGQRHDGGWTAEPVFWVNGPDGTTSWYESRTVTTAFCFEALHAATGEWPPA